MQGESSMQVTYIGHSGFLVEADACYYLFDYFQGEIPELKADKPILVFSSHAHQDHYNPEVFRILRSMGMQQITAVLSKDISEKKYPVAGDDLTCFKVTFYQTYELPCATTLRTLLSTDEGVAFLLQCPEGTIYHAGDLNDWVWEGEPEQYNRQMTGSYRHEIKLLKGYQSKYLNNLPIDIAFIPLDPRQEKDYAAGMLYFLKNINVSKVYPMHFWEQPEIIERFLREYPEYTNLINNIFTKKGDKA